MLGLTSERLIKGATARRAALGLTHDQLERAREAATEALTGGKVRPGTRCTRCSTAPVSRLTGQRGYHALLGPLPVRNAVLRPAEREQQTFVLFDEWIADSRTLERDEALGEFVARYFRSHGPATIRDFAWWSSTTLRDARIGLAIARESLASSEPGR